MENELPPQIETDEVGQALDNHEEISPQKQPNYLLISGLVLLLVIISVFGFLYFNQEKTSLSTIDLVSEENLKEKYNLVSFTSASYEGVSYTVLLPAEWEPESYYSPGSITISDKKNNIFFEIEPRQTIDLTDDFSDLTSKAAIDSSINHEILTINGHNALYLEGTDSARIWFKANNNRVYMMSIINADTFSEEEKINPDMMPLFQTIFQSFTFNYNN